MSHRFPAALLSVLAALACFGGCARKPGSSARPIPAPSAPDAPGEFRPAIPPAPKMAVPPVSATKAASGERVRILKTIEEKGSYAFAQYKASLVPTPSEDPYALTTVAKVSFRNRTVWKRMVCPIAKMRLADLNRDGFPEVIVTDYSMGAHCCFEHFVLTPEPKTGTVREILHWEARDVDIDPEYGHRFEFLSGRPFADILTRDARFAYACGLSFAASPVPRKVFTYHKGKYIPATLAFSGLLRKEQERAQRELSEAVESIHTPGDNESVNNAETDSEREFALSMEEEWDTEHARSVALEAYAYACMLGERDAFLKRTGTGEPAVSDWLLESLKEADALLTETAF